ncbi:cysteine desulfurase [Candidatus Pacearchaeota archaeon]|nr:cysteine desulfurase [Candidatus Pacearchaeota archaeon]
MKTILKKMLDVKKEFPIFKSNPGLVYLDNAATSQKPKTVIESLKNFYEKENANIHRGVYTLSEVATEKYEESRKIIARFINANPEEIIFTKNTTESLNLLSYTIQELIEKGKNEIILTEMEHHSNLVPWQQMAKRNNFKIKFIPIKNFELDYDKAQELITEKTALLSITHVSNVFGTINSIDKLIGIAKVNNVLTIIDAAQSIQHISVDVKKLNCDFLVFSGHKMFGPTGIGILYGKKELLEKLSPFMTGGGMIEKVSYEKASWNEIPLKFEAGTQNIGGVIALGEATNYLEKIGINNIREHEKELLEYALDKLNEIKNIEIYNPGKDKSLSVISFNIKEIHPHDVASILNDYNIAIRAGHHCCMPLMKKLNIPGTCRISLSIYNTKEDIDSLINGLKKVQEVFK